MDYVVLVDDKDQDQGVMEKMEAHVRGELHRAFSIFIFNDQGEMLLQQRSLQKYHSPALWTNACCSHPRPHESLIDAANRRLLEELNVETSLSKMFDFTYHAKFENGLIEHEFDHVFFGRLSQTPIFNQDEIMAVKWISWAALNQWVFEDPNAFTPWFRIALPLVKNKCIEMNSEEQ